MQTCASEIMQEEGETSSDADGVNSNKFRQMMGNKDVHFLSVFALIYVGVEVTMGGEYPSECWKCGRSPKSLTYLPIRLERDIHSRATSWQRQCRLHILWILRR